MTPINYVRGDATNPLGAGPKVIAHCCNDQGRWGKGFVLALSRRWPGGLTVNDVGRSSYRSCLPSPIPLWGGLRRPAAGGAAG